MNKNFLLVGKWLWPVVITSSLFGVFVFIWVMAGFWKALGVMFIVTLVALVFGTLKELSVLCGQKLDKRDY